MAVDQDVSPFDARGAHMAFVAIVGGISARDWAAGWFIGIEHDLWDILDGRDVDGYHLDDDEVHTLRWLAVCLQGWADEERTYTNEEWIAHHAAEGATRR